jgi:predicted permease
MPFFQRIFRRHRMTADLSEELQQHLEEKAAALEAQGMPREEAIHAARRAFGNATLIEQRSREIWLWVWMDNLLRDLRFALRQLRKSPGFTITAVLTLALGIGANLAMFTVIDAVLLRPLPYADSDRLVTLDELDSKKESTFGVIYPDAMEWINNAKKLSGLALFSTNSNFLKGPATTEQVATIQATPNLFSLLGVQPKLGRTYTPAELASGHDQVVILSDALWTKEFHRDPNVLGQTIKLDGQPYGVIGVMPAGFSFPFSETEEQVWTPLTLTPALMTRGNEIANLSAIARLRQNVSVVAAQAELDGLQHSIAREYPANYVFTKPVGVRARAYHSVLFSNLRPALLILQLASGILWLIACANVAGLMLVRGTVRQRELAVRQALGASRKRLLWQSLLDSLLLSLGGSAGGLGIAALALWSFHAALMQRIPALKDIHLNLSVVVVSAAFSVLSALVFGLVPAYVVSRSQVTHVLQQTGPQTTAGGHLTRLRDGLIVTEVALSLALLVACGLLLRTLYALRRVPLGIRTQHIITADLSLPSYRFQHSDVATTLYKPLLEKVHNLPDVLAASLSTTVPLDQSFHPMLTMYQSVTNKNGTQQQPAKIAASFGAMSTGTQQVFGFRMLRGRFFNAQDTLTSQPVVVVNKAFADTWTRDHHDILGKSFLRMSTTDKREAIVVGIMDDLPAYSLDNQHEPQVYLCMNQLQPTDTFYDVVANTHVRLAVRTRENPAAVIPEIRGILAQLLPELHGSKIETMDQVVEDSLGDQKLAAHLLEIFGGTALLITLTGLYGSLLYMVSLRHREMAIRLALGAQRSQLLRLVFSRAAVLLAIGLGAGVAVSYATGQLLRSYLYGVHAHDLFTLLAVALLFAACGALAAYIPARRAASVDPMQALRAE